MRYLLFIVFLIVFNSCENKIKYKEPDDLIPREQMIDLLIDMHIASGTTGVRDKNDDKERNYMSLVYEKYQVDSTRLAESNFYYISNIGEYESIFKEVQKQLKEIQDQNIFIEDSIGDRAIDSVFDKNQIPKKFRGRDIYK